MSQAATGPRSYFPSIEKKYGHPITYWMRQLDDVRTAKHMDQVAHLKGLGMGHGHANAVVHVYRAENDL